MSTFARVKKCDAAARRRAGDRSGWVPGQAGVGRRLPATDTGCQPCRWDGGRAALVTLLCVTALPWRHALRIAADMEPAPPIRIGLHTAIGTQLAQPVAALADLPPVSAAASGGWAVRGIGPWEVVSLTGGSELDDGRAIAVTLGDPVPPGTLAVLPTEWAVVEETAGGHLICVGDANTGVPAHRPGMVTPGVGIAEPGSDARTGDLLIKAGTVVTAGTIALAAAAGVDELAVVPPATVAPIMLGTDLLDSGPPRRGKDRDVVAPLLPSWVIGSGARCLPEVSGPSEAGELADLIDATGADLTVLTATAEPGVGAGVVTALRHLRAEILIEQLATRPADAVLLAELRDGRRILALPREPAAAVVSLAILLTPMMAALSGHNGTRLDTVMLRDGIAVEGFERAAVIEIETGELADLAAVKPWSGPHGLGPLAACDALAFVDPGRGRRGDSLPIVPLPGRR